MSALTPPVKRRGGYTILSITLPDELRDLCRAEVQPGETLTATIRALLWEAVEKRGAVTSRKKKAPATPKKLTGRKGGQAF